METSLYRPFGKSKFVQNGFQQEKMVDFVPAEVPLPFAKHYSTFYDNQLGSILPLRWKNYLRSIVDSKLREIFPIAVVAYENFFLIASSQNLALIFSSITNARLISPCMQHGQEPSPIFFGGGQGFKEQQGKK